MAVEVNAFVIWSLVFCCWQVKGSPSPEMLQVDTNQHESIRLICKINSPSVFWWLNNTSQFEIGNTTGGCHEIGNRPIFMKCDCIPPTYSCLFNLSDDLLGKNTVCKCSVVDNNTKEHVFSNVVPLVIQERITTTASISDDHASPSYQTRQTCFSSDATIDCYGFGLIGVAIAVILVIPLMGVCLVKAECCCKCLLKKIVRKEKKKYANKMKAMEPKLTNLLETTSTTEHNLKTVVKQEPTIAIMKSAGKTLERAFKPTNPAVKTLEAGLKMITEAVETITHAMSMLNSAVKSLKSKNETNKPEIPPHKEPGAMEPAQEDIKDQLITLESANQILTKKLAEIEPAVTTLTQALDAKVALLTEKLGMMQPVVKTLRADLQAMELAAKTFTNELRKMDSKTNEPGTQESPVVPIIKELEQIKNEVETFKKEFTAMISELYPDPK